MFTETHSLEAPHIAIGIHAGRRRTVARSGGRTEAKREVQTQQRKWLLEVLEKVKLKPSQLAIGAGVSDTTITRILNNEDYLGTLAPETIERIKGTYKVPGPEEFANRSRSSVIGFSEASRFDAGREAADLAVIVDAILRGRSNMHVWRLKTMALEGVGYLPGDLVFVEHLPDTISARPQDAVCAQVVDYQHGAAETVWRVYDPPFLVGAANDRTAYKPILVDGDRVKIAGVIRESYRPHSLSATRGS
jgi:hypothetical protein